MKLPRSLIQLRPAEVTDIGFITKTWLHSYRESPFGRNLTLETYEMIQTETITALVGENRVTIACVPEEPDALMGFICHGRIGTDTGCPTTAVHYIYVKGSYRNAGLAQYLLETINPTTPIVCTQPNRFFYELRSVNFLPMMTLREYDDLISKLKPGDNIKTECNQWFIDQLPTFRQHRAEIMKERNQRAYRKRNRQRVPDSLRGTGPTDQPLQANQETTNEADRSATQRTPGIADTTRKGTE